MYRRTTLSDHRATRRNPYAMRATPTRAPSPSIVPHNGMLSRLAASALLALPRIVATLAVLAIMAELAYRILGN